MLCTDYMTKFIYFISGSSKKNSFCRTALPARRQRFSRVVYPSPLGRLGGAAFCFLAFALSAICQPKQDIKNYIEKYKDIAIEEMVRCKIPASITLAQGLHESGFGKSPLAKEANNHFGIKCKGEWDGKGFYKDDDAPNECFRVYQHAEASYADHSDFLVTRPRYAFLFELPIADYKSWARGLKEAGYATNPKYPEILIHTIEENQLYLFDKAGIAMIGEREKALYPENAQNPILAKEPINAVAIKKPKYEHVHKENTPSPANANESPRKEYMVNGSRVIQAQANEDPLKIAYDYMLDYSHLLAFNDLGPGERFKEGENIFLQSKKTKGEVCTYLVQTGESMRDISQKFGIKLNTLYAKNLMNLNDQVYTGETISLQEKERLHPKQ